MEKKVKRGVDAVGWLGWVAAVGVLWLILMRNAYDEYFSRNGMEMAKLVAALFGTVICWLVHLSRKARDWEDYGEERLKWQADHDIRFAEQIFKVTFGKALEIYNIAAGQKNEADEVIGG